MLNHLLFCIKKYVEIFLTLFFMSTFIFKNNVFENYLYYLSIYFILLIKYLYY